MAMTQPELLAADDATIDDAVQYADPLILRGLVFQLTADESLASGVRVDSQAEGYRARAARLLWEWLRDPRTPHRATPAPDEDEVMRMRNIISPYFGQDINLA